MSAATNQMKCANCGKSLSCGCKKRTASNKRSCCASCITSYEASLKIKK